VITAILPTFNEERHIGRCLDSLLRQQGVDDFEILVVDGRSTDRTLDVVRSFPEFGRRIRLIENPRRFQVYAWNAGCSAARGEYFAFISAHTEYDPAHLAKCLQALHRTGAEAVGPLQLAEGDGDLGTAIAWCMSSPMGIGNARFRFTEREEEVESVFSMFLRRETFERLGGYDERVAFDEDGEFNYRLRAAGGRIVVTPTIRARYFVRESLGGLARQMFCYGYWRRFTQVLHPAGVPLRVYAPPALVAGLVASLALLATPFRPLAALLPAIYLAYAAAGGVKAYRSIGAAAALRVPLVLAYMHVAYGLGFWRGLLTPSRSVLGPRVRASAAADGA